MRSGLSEKLQTEITRKEFLQYSAGVLLMLFGLNNFIMLLTGDNPSHHFLKHTSSGASGDGFGSRKFGE